MRCSVFRYLSFLLKLGGKRIWNSLVEILLRDPLESDSDPTPVNKLKFEFSERVVETGAEDIYSAKAVAAGDAAIFRVGVRAEPGWSDLNVVFRGFPELGEDLRGFIWRL